MFDDVDRAAVFDFEEISGFLFDQGAGVGAAQVHGCLSGLLAAGGADTAEYGLHAMSLALEVSPHGELASLVMQLYAATAIALVDDELGFQPLLPGDDIDIAQRTAAVAGWCSGFLSGIAEIDLGDAKGDDWSADGRELLGDIAALAQAQVGEHETQEEAEDSYLELVEYLRLAVLNLAMERGPGGASPVAGVTLH